MQLSLRPRIAIPDNVPLDKACLVGCGVMTGVGAAINTAKVAPGSSAVVIGCGGVGLNVIQGCAVAGARTIVGVDLLDNKLDYAKEFGATHTINPGRQDLLKTVRGLTNGRGADCTFEVIGLSKTLEQAFACTQRGGTMIIVGAGSREDLWQIPVGSFLMTEKVIKSSTYGSSRPRMDLPRLIDLYMNRQLKLDELISRTYPLDDINQSMTALEKGRSRAASLLCERMIGDFDYRETL
jgi:S-(hydroxymethyl)glutathione dehydrogenase/alcohol dehydrogenase